LERPYFVTARPTGVTLDDDIVSASPLEGILCIKISEETHIKTSHYYYRRRCYYYMRQVVAVPSTLPLLRTSTTEPPHRSWDPGTVGTDQSRTERIRGGRYVRAARNETDGQECARRTVAVARDKCRTRTTRIIIYNIILWKKTQRDVRRPRSRRSESEPVVPLGDRSINQPPPPPPPCVERGSRARDDPVCCFVSAPGRRRRWLIF